LHLQKREERHATAMQMADGRLLRFAMRRCRTLNPKGTVANTDVYITVQTGYGYDTSIVPREK